MLASQPSPDGQVVSTLPLQSTIDAPSAEQVSAHPPLVDDALLLAVVLVLAVVLALVLAVVLTVVLALVLAVVLTVVLAAVLALPPWVDELPAAAPPVPATEVVLLVLPVAAPPVLALDEMILPLPHAASAARVAGGATKRRNERRKGCLGM